jgi:D-glycero-beta-D-manno-heptose 1-phosphate adenylyltransferase
MSSPLLDPKSFTTYTDKIVVDQERLGEIAAALKALGRKIVVTIGSWDLLHIGHVRYLITAAKHGCVLIVGVDSDRGIKAYKGPLRPVVPEDERREMLTYQDCVDYVTTVDDIDDDGKWEYGLLECVRPDVFVAVEDSYPEEQLADIKERAGKVVVLPRQAEQTSTSRLIQVTLKRNLEQLVKRLGEE